MVLKEKRLERMINRDHLKIYRIPLLSSGRSIGFEIYDNGT